mmetsp:Transcript_48115/g.77639  ORF Transcript_48115/g.77639 Transcript_48115/m.77639 type:complete len:81 (+) Transcript_48115:156-398(+)
MQRAATRCIDLNVPVSSLVLIFFVHGEHKSGTRGSYRVAKTCKKSVQVIFRKRAIKLVANQRKEICKRRHPMGLRRAVLR